MSPEKQRIAIAEACGFKWYKARLARCRILLSEGSSYIGTMAEAEPTTDFSLVVCGDVMREIPDYLNDLNAMHEAEKGLTKEHRDTYRDFIKEICFSAWIGGKHFDPFPDFSTAAQRAEALLRTIGKWEA